jgi:PAS domain S-box-containing protein
MTNTPSPDKRISKPINECLVTERTVSQTPAHMDSACINLLNVMREGICIMRDWTVLYINAAGLRMFGATSADQMVGMPTQNFVHPDDRNTVMDRMTRVVFGRDIIEAAELRYQRLDGTSFDVETLGSPIEYSGGPAVLISFKDITESKKLDQMLRENERKYRQLIEMIPDAIAVVKRGRIAYLNSTAVRFLSCVSDVDGVGRGALEYIHPNYRAAAVRWAKAAFEGERVGMEESVIQLVDGGTLDVEILMEKIQFDGEDAALVIVRDVSACKKARHELEVSERFARSIADNVPGFLSYWSDELICTFTNKSSAQEFGITSENILGKNVQELMPFDHRDTFEKAARLALAGTDSGYHREVHVAGSVQRDIWVQFQSDWRAGNVVGVFALASDITELKVAENDSKEARILAEKANAAKSKFLATASHDLRQPVASLTLYADELMDMVQGPAIEVTEHIQSCVESLGNMLSNLLDVSKFDAGVINAVIETFPVNDMLKNVFAENVAQANEKGLDLRFVPCTCVGHTDVRQLTRVLNNVVANAIKFTSAGGVLISCRRRGGRDWLEVWDTGIGIPEDQTEAIFEEFNQLGDQARSSGSGLGLAIVARVCSLLGLKKSVRSRVGKGSVFAIELPLAKRIDVQPKMESFKEKTKLLLIEDNVALLQTMIFVLGNAGFAVYGGSSLEDAMTKLQDIVPDVVISDYRLANSVTGIDVISKIRQQHGYDVPAVLFTGDTDPSLIKSMHGSGIDILYKPVRVPVLKDAIMKALANSPQECAYAG